MIELCLHSFLSISKYVMIKWWVLSWVGEDTSLISNSQQKVFFFIDF